MLRKIIQIDEDKCTGCGICVDACHEGAIGLVNGKAKLMRDDYCDGLGDCLPTCPTGAISFIEKDTLAYDEEAVKKNMEKRMQESGTMHSGCPGSMMHTLNPVASSPSIDVSSQLTSWPVQIKLAPINAPFFQHAKLLVAADCTAYAYANFHQEFMRNKVTLIGCPKLDDGDYSEKLTEIFTSNKIKSIHLVRMMVPCCGGLSKAVANAIAASGKQIPCTITTISPQGEIIRTERI